MKVTSMAISNLYSYSYAKANFEDFNVFVGHNVAGKTNLVRILQILVKHPEDDD
jgi:predicted ATPase